MPGSDLDLLIDAARAAGEIARRFFERGAERWDKPGGEGPVTEADLAVNARLEDSLRAARPDYGWLSEESADDPDRLTREALFIVDPIDGTRNFIEGSRAWAHSLAVVREGQVTAGVVYLPMMDKLYAAGAGLGATLNGATIRASERATLEAATVLSARPAFEAGNWKDGRIPQAERVYRPSLAYRLSLVAEGRFDAMLTLRPTWEWDIAAGDVILREAGATISDRRGGALRYNGASRQVNGVVSGGAPVHGALIRALV